MEIMLKSLRSLKHKLLLKHEGEKQLKSVYAHVHGKSLDIQTAESFTEKLYKRMILIQRQGNKTFTRLSDKYAVRDYIRSMIGEKYLIKLLWVGENPQDIPFDKLPQKYIIKTNHGSGGNIIVDGEPDKADIIARMGKLLNENFYWQAREFHYYSIKPKVIIEEFLDELDPLDYRFFCFNGEPEVIQVDNHKHDINPFYDKEWSKLDLHYREKFNDIDIEYPKNFPLMLDIAKKLSANFDFVRVDLYNVRGRIYFGEMTFTPVAGQFKFNSDEWDKKLGKKWIWNRG